MGGQGLEYSPHPNGVPNAFPNAEFHGQRMPRIRRSEYLHDVEGV